MSNKTFYVITGTFLGVIAIRMLIGDHWGFTNTFSVWIIFLGVVFGLLSLVLRSYRRISLSILLMIAGVFLVAGVALLRVQATVYHDQETQIENIPRTPIEIQGVIVGDRDNRLAHTKILLEVDTIVVSNQEYSVTTRVLVTSERFEQFQSGDRIAAIGRLQVPESFITDTGREFDYGAYLWKNDIPYVMYYPELQVIESTSNSLSRKLFALKDTLIKTSNKYVPQPEAALLSGVLFGDKAGLGPALQDAFRRSGLVHIIVLSGFNISIIAYFLFMIFAWAPKRIAIALSAVCIVAFAVMVGGGPTVVRASIMALLVLLALSIGRAYDIMRALWFAAVVMVFLNPKILLADISFQLSFLATFGLIVGAPYFERLFSWFPSVLKLREFLVATITTQVFVLPLLIIYTGEISIISILVNLLVLPVVPLVMLFGLFVGITGLFWSGLASAIAVPTWLMLRYITGAVEFFGNIKFASIRIPPEGFWVIILIYAGILGYILYRRSRGMAPVSTVTPWEVSADEVGKILGKRN